jgi:4-hydroxy-tetrahydrodipicolinate synthase
MKFDYKSLTGCITALITPFKNGEIDYDAYGNLIDFQINSGVSGLVILGTTGESATVEETERRELISFAKRKINGRVPMLVGTGSNSTKRTVAFTEDAEKCGADAILTVTPYYNKATVKGLTEHYRTVAKSTSLPVILYNVPARTGVNMTAATLKNLMDVSNIVGIKEASGSIENTLSLLSETGKRFDVYSGCDELTVPLMSIGAKGVISACANVIPEKMAAMCRDFIEGRVEKSGDTQREI